MRPRSGGGPLRILLQRPHGNVEPFGELGHIPFAERVGVGLVPGARIVLRNLVLMLPAVRLFGERQVDGPGFRRGLEISGARGTLRLRGTRHGEASTKLSPRPSST